MIDAISVYTDVLDTINKSEGGYMSIEMYNRFSRRAELRLLDWISGDISGNIPPEPYATQKNKDWLVPFIKEWPLQPVNGKATRPSDYYLYEAMTVAVADSCDSDTEPEYKKYPVTLLSTPKYNNRKQSYIRSKKPSLRKAISKQIGKDFEFCPSDIGLVMLEYKRYPLYAVVGKKFDPVYNNEVPDAATTINYEWDENVRDILVWFITDFFATHIRETALKQQNNTTGKTPRG